ncbi:cohesin subunit SA-1 isoform X2 [Poecilia reticulata]|uniref:cohesin subunit SA-1 isoform X2 n=1 Tax=Poecilia reticulata TaxID=8081 RepID=UPI0007EA214F|nr:PREDICTED: cohesin subunit SA-3 isoform X2 [Poecilia reticulata]
METGSSDSLEELDLSSESGSIYESQTKARKRSKQSLPAPQPPKRPRRNAALRVRSSTSSSPITDPSDPSQQHPSPSQGTSRKLSSRRVTSEESQGISAKDIYDAVRSGKSAMVTVVEEWLCSYKQSREEGLLVLINFIVLSCGCKGVVSREMYESMENAEIISTLTKEFNEDSVNYPLITPGPQFKRFKAGLCEFVRILVHSCRNSLVYDEFLFPSLLALLTGLSDSQVRAFRHTSTLLAMKLMTGLVDVAVAVSVQLQTTQRQCDIENSKSPCDRGSDRLEELKTAIRELQENRAELSFMMNATFRGVFVHRYRDRLADIRAACIEELGLWLKTDPDNFLNDRCLKYLGWTLHDKGLYQEKEFIGRLELFTSRFKERILSMVLDKDPDVAVEVVNLLLMIQHSTEDDLMEEESGHIYPLVYASHRGLASAAGAFLCHKLKRVVTSQSQDDDDKSNNAAFFQILISFYIQSEFHEHGAYLVDSLWTVAGSELRDWDTMTTLLLQDSGLMYEEEGALLEIMICAIREAAEATPPAGRSQGKKILSMKLKKIQEQDRTRITTHFIPVLPQLLSKYSADAEKTSLLLRAPLYFDLHMYSSTQWLEKHLDLLLSQICTIVKKHTDAAVLQACALLVSTLCSESHTFSSRAHLVFSQLMDELTECFNSYLSDLLQGAADEDGVYNAASALKRIAALCSAKDPTRWELLDSCMELLKNRIESLDFDTELLVAALKCAAFHLMWAKLNAVNLNPAEDDLTHLRKKVRLFCRICQTCLSLDQTEIRDQAFELLCDLLLLYGAVSVRGEPVVRALVHLPSDSLRAELASFLLDYVFNDSENIELDDEGLEKKVALLQKKRNQLGGYCKLVLYGVLDLSAATNVFKHYSKYFKDFGDIIKETVSKSKLINPIQSAKIVCLSLQQLFSEMLTEGHDQQDFTEIRELARKLAMSFGVDLRRSRKQLVALHLDGIRFAFRVPQEGEVCPNVSFLEILSEFSFKLLAQDCAQLAQFLKSECPSAALSWPSVKLYRRSLESRTSKYKDPDEGSKADSSPHTPVTKRKRITAQGSASCTARGSLLESSSIQSHLHTPALTSTVLKRRTKRATAKKPTATVSDRGNVLTELDSEDEFSCGSNMRKVKPTKRGKASSVQTSTQQEDLDSHLNLLSLIEDDISKRAGSDISGEEEPEIEDYESDKGSEFTLPSMRHTSASILDQLFD